MDTKKIILAKIRPVLSLQEFNTRNAKNEIIPALGKDYFLINSAGNFESCRLQASTDRAQLKQYVAENRVFVFDEWAAVVQPDGWDINAFGPVGQVPPFKAILENLRS